ncbi:MAG TPA: DUF5667 domain-containing protein [Chloroflexia bacterium]|nr:DUF5667 domain-containing protein [Chloroflexia bacterium]
MERAGIQDALEYCLANPDNLGAEELLGRFPEYREELEPLLRISRSIQGVEPPPVPVERRSAMKHRLMQAAAERQMAAQAQTASITPVPVRKQPTLKVHTQKRGWKLPFFSRAGWALAGAMALMVLFIWWSAARALPNSPFYSVKLASENFALNLANSPEEKVRRHVDLANARLFDLETMRNMGKLGDAGAAVEDCKYHLTAGSMLWEQTQGSVRTELAKDLYISSQAGRVTFAEFEEAIKNLPATMRKNFQDTIDAINGLNRRTMAALLGEGIDPNEVTEEANPEIAPLLTPTDPVPESELRTPTRESQGTNTPSVVRTVSPETRVPGQVTPSAVVAGGTATAPVASPSAGTSTISVPTATPVGKASPSLTATPTQTATPSASPTRVSATATGTPTARPSSTPIGGVRTSTPTPTITPNSSATSTRVAATPSPTESVLASTATPERLPPGAVTVVPDPTTVPQASATPVPVNTPPPAPTSTPAVEPSPPPPAPTSTWPPLLTPTPLPGGGNGDACDLRVEDVGISCGPGSCATWTVLISNEGERSVRANWTATLEIKPVGGGGWEEVEEISGTSNFRPGETTLRDRMCFSANEPIDKIRVVFTVASEEGDCESHKQSGQISPCEVGGGVVPTVTHVPPVVPTKTRVPPTKPPKPTRTPPRP